MTKARTQAASNLTNSTARKPGEPPQVETKLHLDALTGLRFCAALAVYLSHHPKPSYLPLELATFLNAGYDGVTIFFVLSGFVIGLNYLESFSKPSWRVLLRFFAARLARIYPLYALVLTFVWLNSGAHPDSNLILHYFALQSWSSDMYVLGGYNGPGWSIGVEFLFYASFPFLAFALIPLRRRSTLLWLTAFFVTSMMLAAVLFFYLTHRESIPWPNPESPHYWLYFFPISRLGDFVLGVIGSMIFRQLLVPQSRRLWAGLTYGAAGAIVLLMTWPANFYSPFSWDVAYAPLTFILLLGLTLAPTSLLSRFLALRWMVILGEASFALYLIHVPMMTIFNIFNYSTYDPFVALCLWAAFGGICLILSIGLNQYIEKPLRHSINRWVARLTET